MKTYIALITGLIFLLLLFVIVRALLKKIRIVGKPPVHIFFFLLAKICFLICLAFLVAKALVIGVPAFRIPVFFEYVGALLLTCGFVVVLFATYSLGRDLIFGLSDSESHSLQTGGIYKFSRHPFYLGFLMILLSSCLFIPNFINILSFIVTWIIHHQIMRKEEEYLTGIYGNEYAKYKEKVNRYITL
jgi:protein-S-isoprenylcysteine O-methyltransferase Ste14